MNILVIKVASLFHFGLLVEERKKEYLLIHGELHPILYSSMDDICKCENKCTSHRYYYSEYDYINITQCFSCSNGIICNTHLMSFNINDTNIEYYIGEFLK